ncbi:MAG: hypothetical protein A2W93_11650 [Bacteroidetes bacterium GWF2_43_63]|nr:MAG: hypothetical protein A2W94_14520 [Bacteroidetes bacterium GWE2_42_42]OFY54924.1 MAG: hypothetical protein A2W93_11650 [Bacteroidetes bacterium GWF2_43_63]HCB63168.1 hypothetical protein [Bacteroidales bacterium]HCY22227.1 hypothetical protein [Bacteroidales bacterium]
MQIPLKDKHPIIQLISFIGLSLAGVIAVMFLGMLAGALIWGPSFTDALLVPGQGGEYIMHMKYIQILSHLGMFIVPAFVFGRLAGGNTIKYFSLNRGMSIGLFLTSVILIVLSQPLINLLTEWNSGFTLPESMSALEAWMKETEDQAAALTELFMATTSWSGLAVNLFMMAVIPALGEELVFRGILQRLMVKWLRSAWVAILLTAIIFSAFHMQFYGFLPRVVLGIILGYSFFATGKLWVPMLIHFVNNGMAVVVYWLNEKGMIEVDPETFGSFNDNPLILILSLLLFSASFYIFALLAKKQSNEQTGTV